MSEDPATKGQSPKIGMLRRAWRSLVNRVVQYVPSEDAACEFDCQVTDCDSEKWEKCERRRTAAEESTPVDATPSGKPASMSK